MEWIFWMKHQIQHLFQYQCWMFVTPRSLIALFSWGTVRSRGPPLGLPPFYPSDIRRWHRLKRTHPHELSSSKGNKENKGKNTWIVTDLLRCFIVADDVKLVIQGAGVVSEEGFTGLLGTPTFLLAFGNSPCVRVPLPGSCLVPASQRTACFQFQLSDLKHCQDLITQSLEK